MARKSEPNRLSEDRYAVEKDTAVSLTFA